MSTRVRPTPLPTALLLMTAVGLSAGCADYGAADELTGGSRSRVGGKADDTFSDGGGADGLPCEVRATLSYCVNCHSGPMAKKGVHLDSYAAVTGASPQDPGVTVAERALFRMTFVAKPMPPPGKPAPTPAEVSAFEAWILAGMPATGCAPADAGSEGGVDGGRPSDAGADAPDGGFGWPHRDAGDAGWPFGRHDGGPFRSDGGR